MRETPGLSCRPSGSSWRESRYVFDWPPHENGNWPGLFTSAGDGWVASRLCTTRRCHAASTSHESPDGPGCPKRRRGHEPAQVAPGHGDPGILIPVCGVREHHSHQRRRCSTTWPQDTGHGHASISRSYRNVGGNHTADDRHRHVMSGASTDPRIWPANITSYRRTRRLLPTGQPRSLRLHPCGVPQHHALRSRWRTAAVSLPPRAQPIRHQRPSGHGLSGLRRISLHSGRKVPMRPRKRPARHHHPHHDRRPAARDSHRAGRLQCRWRIRLDLLPRRPERPGTVHRRVTNRTNPPGNHSRSP